MHPNTNSHRVAVFGDASSALALGTTTDRVSSAQPSISRSYRADDYDYKGRPPSHFNLFDVSGAGRRAARSKVYPFSSDRQNLRHARSQIMVTNANGFSVMNTVPSRNRLTKEQYDYGVRQSSHG